VAVVKYSLTTDPSEKFSVIRNIPDMEADILFGGLIEFCDECLNTEKRPVLGLCFFCVRKKYKKYISATTCCRNFSQVLIGRKMSGLLFPMGAQPTNPRPLRFDSHHLAVFPG